ncbi:ATP-grasp domain-containing protein [Streptomyces sp. S1A]|uniref:ATP-grasp domain-containing protein n=1 Tax=Streptomyces sp. ICN903 TaxID=2964654 RepID=UPI001EDB4377|nr:ATP-grasp domain-containing protein [Streptomyces sp. ICN903]MCG3039817.1 ATP-grasp domain-containing protein [Streptomyces sp. ICN903]
MKIGLLGWDYSGIDPDGTSLVEYGRERGHDTSFFTLEEIAYHPGPEGVELTLKGEPAASFDAVINRSKLYGDDWRDRVERLAMLSNVPGPMLFDPVDVWLTGYSKFLMAQKLAAAGLPVPPVRSAASLADVETAFEEWGDIILKPSYGYRGQDVERIRDFGSQKEVAEDLLARFSTVLCQPYYPTEGGEYRISVAGDTTPINMLKLPPAGSWRCKTLEGASFERIDAPDELVDLSVRATRVLGMTLSGLDVLPHEGGYMILEVNPVPGFLSVLGAEQHRQVLAGVYDWVERKVQEGPSA